MSEDVKIVFPEPLVSDPLPADTGWDQMLEQIPLLIAALDRNTAARALDLTVDEMEVLRESERCGACGHRIMLHHYAGCMDECRVEGCACAL